MQEIHDENQTMKEDEQRKKGDVKEIGEGGSFRGGEAYGPHNFHLNFGEVKNLGDGRPFWGGANFRLAWAAAD